MSDIGRRIIETESHAPGIVRLCPNPLKIPGAAAMLIRMGFRKRFLVSPQQFVYDCFLQYQPAIEALLPYSLLTRTPDADDDRYHCWTGIGEYAGWQALLRINDFSSGGKDRCVLIVNVTPFFHLLNDLLDPVKVSS